MQYLSLARLDKPIGIYLLLWPTLAALWIAADGWPGWHLLLVFTLGTILMRSAGCIVNDIADREFDRSVQRTRNRPLTSGMLSVPQALVFLAVLLFIALILVLSTNLLTVLMAVLAVLIAAVYPFMKRYTYMPQAILGVAFSWGIPMAFAASQDQVPQIAWLLLVANLIWTVGYDTEYAMVDREDDIKLGLKSSAILFADMDKLMIGILQVLFIATMLLVGTSLELTLAYQVGLGVASVLLVYQQYLIRDRSREGCFAAFTNNHWVGLIILIGIIAGTKA
jgi:4-hydroxybenzoate polyprenyltransferase